MYMNIAVVLILAIIVMATNKQGVFTNILLLASTVVAGAITFALWEPVFYLLFDAIDKPWAYDYGWGISFLIIFAIARISTQVLTDKACPGNVFLPETPNWIGSGLIGAMNGVLTVGFIVIGMHFIQGPTKLLGYQAWKVDSDGSVVREDTLWIPCDQIVTYIYSKGSLGSMWVPEPMAKLYPDLSKSASLYRISYSDGQSRQGLKPGGVTADTLILITPPDADFISTLPGTKDPVFGGKLTSGDLYAVTIDISNAASDGGSKLRLMKSQVGLIVETEDEYGDIGFATIHPHAFYQKYDPAQPGMARFEFDIGDVVATSVGSGVEIRMGFEFLIPTDAEPLYLTVRNMRAELPDETTPMLYRDLQNYVTDALKE